MASQQTYAAHEETAAGSALPESESLYPAFSILGIDTNQVDPAVVRRKLDRHLLPCFFTLAVCCYLDRSSLAFGSLQLMEDLSFSKTVYGIGAGIFFVGYASFQVPSNLVLAGVGAPTWLAVLMVFWGIVDASQAAIRTPTHFYVLRFLLGVAECGAFPGMWYHMHLFYTSDQLGLAYSTVASATALSQVIGGPLAAGILALDGLAGLQGWQLLFLLQGLPTIGLGCFLKAYLVESPGRAAFLSPAEREWLVKLKGTEGAGGTEGGSHSTRPAVDWSSAAEVCRKWRVWYLGLVWFLVDATQYGVLFWAPLLLDALQEGDFNGGASREDLARPSRSGEEEVWHDVRLSAMSALIFVPAAAGMILNAFSARAARERRWHSALPVAAGGLCLGFLPLVMKLLGTIPAVFTLMLAAAGVWAIHGPFFSWPSDFLRGSEAAAGIALINTLGACGGVVGPFLIGRLADATGGSYALPMAALAVMDVLAAALLIGFPEPQPMDASMEAIPASDEVMMSNQRSLNGSHGVIAIVALSTASDSPHATPGGSPTAEEGRGGCERSDSGASDGDGERSVLSSTPAAECSDEATRLLHAKHHESVDSL